MDNRFHYVVATDMKSLVEELNKRSEQYWFTVVYMSNGIAVIDCAVDLVQPVAEDEFAEIQMNAVPPSPSFA